MRVLAAADAQEQDRVRARRAVAEDRRARLLRPFGARVGAEHEDRVRRGQREAAAGELRLRPASEIFEDWICAETRKSDEREQQPADDREGDPLDDAAGGDAPLGRRVSAPAADEGAASGERCGGRGPRSRGGSPASRAIRPNPPSSRPCRRRAWSGRRCSRDGRRVVGHGSGCKVAGVAERYVIGVDIGGTKLLAGAVDAERTVSHRTNRPVLGLDQTELLDMIVDAVEHIRTARRRRRRGRLRDPLHVRPAHRRGRPGGAPPAARPGVRRGHAGAPRRCRSLADNDGNCSALCEARAGAARGCSDVVMLTLGHRHRRRARARRQALPRLDGRGGRARAHGHRRRRAAVPRQLPEPRLPRGHGLRHGAGARGRRWRSRAAPTPRSARRSRRAAS